MRWFLTGTLLLLGAGCASTRSAKAGNCPVQPICLSAPQCYVDGNGCEICQCSPAYDDWRSRQAGPPPSLNP